MQGWTIVEILQYAPVHNWFAYEELLKSHPVLAKMMISGTVYALGDWIAQCVEGKPALEFNRPRMLRSGLVGFCLHGSMSHFYYQFCEVSHSLSSTSASLLRSISLSLSLVVIDLNFKAVSEVLSRSFLSLSFSSLSIKFLARGDLFVTSCTV